MANLPIAPNLLTNGSFAPPPPPACPTATLLIGFNYYGNAAAPPWLTWTNLYIPPGPCAYLSTAIIKLGDVTKPPPPPVVINPNPQPCLNDFLRPLPETQQVIEICTNKDSSGIDQVFGNASSPWNRVRASAWVFVLSGQVKLGAGPVGSSNPPLAGSKNLSTLLYQWEQLDVVVGRLPPLNKPVEQITIYSNSPGGAWFFAANASVVAL